MYESIILLSTQPNAIVAASFLDEPYVSQLSRGVGWTAVESLLLFQICQGDTDLVRKSGFTTADITSTAVDCTTPSVTTKQSVRCFSSVCSAVVEVTTTNRQNVVANVGKISQAL